MIKQASSNNLPTSQKPHSSPKPDPRVTAELGRKSPPPQHRRKTNVEWAQFLDRMSGAITSSTWEGEVRPSHRKSLGEHSARRSEETVRTLPTRKTDSESVDGDEGKKGRVNGDPQLVGRLSQNQILALYVLRRRDPGKWSAEKIARKFNVSEKDVRHLLTFTRTYKGMEEPDGHMLAYYKKDGDDVIVRFERD